MRWFIVYATCLLTCKATANRNQGISRIFNQKTMRQYFVNKSQCVGEVSSDFQCYWHQRWDILRKALQVVSFKEFVECHIGTAIVPQEWMMHASW